MEGYIEFDTEPLLSKIDNSDSDDFCNPGFDGNSFGKPFIKFGFTKLKNNYYDCNNLNNSL